MYYEETNLQRIIISIYQKNIPERTVNVSGRVNLRIYLFFSFDNSAFLYFFIFIYKKKEETKQQRDKAIIIEATNVSEEYFKVKIIIRGTKINLIIWKKASLYSGYLKLFSAWKTPVTNVKKLFAMIYNPPNNKAKKIGF